MPSQKYLARIHIMKKEKAVPEDDYRDILYRKFRVATSSALSDSQALVFIRSLRDYHKDPYASSDEMRWKFNQKWDEYHHDHCNCGDKMGHQRRFLFKRFKISDINFSDRRKAYEATEAVKSMIESAEKRRSGEKISGQGAREKEAKNQAPMSPM